MKKKSCFFVCICLIILLLPEFILAREAFTEDIPIDFFDDGPDPPPSAPIDNYLFYLVLIAVSFAAYNYYKSYLLKRE